VTATGHQTCTRCVMDTTDPRLTFDVEGVCGYCRQAEARLPSYRFGTALEKRNLDDMARRIKKHARGKYDCIIGLSGGVDSSYVAYLAKQMNLRPLCVHFDNGWNTEIAVRNIQGIVRTCGFDLVTYVIDWPEFRDLQRAFLRAGVIDLEMLSDHAIFASMLKLRRKFGLRYVLSGTNYATEHGLPDAWIWPKMDWRNIRGIHRRFGDGSIKTFPHMTSLRWLLMRHLNLGGVYLEPLNQVTYTKSAAMKTLEREFGWRYYGGKHYESTITKFYQAYILPTKFGVDKRKSHLSALIRNGEITRGEALLELKAPPYDPAELKKDMEFVLKKLGFTPDEFDEIMRKLPRRHDEYPTDQWYMRPIMKFGKLILKKR
jgi:N-acetyl sugar amidotransferase